MTAETAAAAPELSIVVPTYREAENLPLLVEHIIDGLGDSGLTWELVVANDDSGDGTDTVCAALAERHPVRLLNRTRDRGLALAVIDGFQEARGAIVVVMDADQSHPASVVPEMVARLRAGDADFVIGSRKVSAGTIESDWPLARHVGTFCATAIVRPLVKVKDPMAGFFAMRRADWPTVPLRPIGYKIALELIVRGAIPPERVLELPIHFTDRKVGESKMGARELHNYLRHVMNLYRFRWPVTRLVLHAAVGVIGLVVDVACYLLLQAAGLGHLGARLVSYWPAVVTNWWLNRLYTYDDRPRRGKARQLFEFCQVSLLGFGANAVVYHLLTKYVAWFTERTLLALFIGVVVGLAVNYVGSNLRVYGAAGDGQDRPKSSS